MIKDPEKKAEYDRAYRLRHKEEIAERKHLQYQKDREKWLNVAKLWRKNNPLYSRDRSRRIRTTVITYLGNRCVKCGNSDIRVLCIDHVNGGGCQERKALTYHGFLWKLKKAIDARNETILSQYQLLCANCNAIKKFERDENFKRSETIGRKALKGKGEGKP